LPPAVIERAKSVLELLQSSEQSGNLAKLATDLPLFSAARPVSAEPQNSALEIFVKDINPDALSPKAALDLIYELKKIADKPQ